MICHVGFKCTFCTAKRSNSLSHSRFWWITRHGFWRIQQHLHESLDFFLTALGLFDSSHRTYGIRSYVFKSYELLTYRVFKKKLENIIQLIVSLHFNVQTNGHVGRATVVCGLCRKFTNWTTRGISDLCATSSSASKYDFAYPFSRKLHLKTDSKLCPQKLWQQWPDHLTVWKSGTSWPQREI